MTFAEYFFGVVNESLKAEKQLFDDPAIEFYLDITPEDDNEGVISYNDQEIPVSKHGGGGHVEYTVGSVVNSKKFVGNTPNTFLKVKQAIVNGEIKAVSSYGQSKNITRDIPDTVEIEMANGDMKEYKYVSPGEVDSLITQLRKKYGTSYTEYVKQYATDRQNARSDNPYIPVSQIAKQNIFLNKLGPKDGSINYRTR